MAVEMVAWAGRHVDVIFVGCLIVIGVRFAAECAQAVSRGVERYRVLRADRALRGVRR